MYIYEYIHTHIFPPFSSMGCVWCVCVCVCVYTHTHLVHTHPVLEKGGGNREEQVLGKSSMITFQG